MLDFIAWSLKEFLERGLQTGIAKSISPDVHIERCAYSHRPSSRSIVGLNALVIEAGTWLNIGNTLVSCNSNSPFIDRVTLVLDSALRFARKQVSVCCKEKRELFADNCDLRYPSYHI